MPGRNQMDDVTPADVIAGGANALERFASFGRYGLRSGGSALMSSMRLSAYRNAKHGGVPHHTKHKSLKKARSKVKAHASSGSTQQGFQSMRSQLAGTQFAHSGKPLTSGKKGGKGYTPGVARMNPHIKTRNVSGNARISYSKPYRGKNLSPPAAIKARVQAKTRKSGGHASAVPKRHKVGANTSIASKVNGHLARKKAAGAKAARRKAASRPSRSYVQSYKRRDSRTGKMVTVKGTRWKK